MIVRIDSDGSVSLDDPDSFTAFHVRAPGLTLAQVLEALGDRAAPSAKDAHVWVPIERLHALGAKHGGNGWREGCDGMIAYAQTRGWIHDEGDLVLAHIES